jgi:putative peptide zinc metalloprotease protein
LTQDITDRVLTPKNVFLLWLTFPFLKIFHEFGHAYAIKRFGGEVHDMGVMLLVLTPIPYVDASSASALHGKWERIAVSAAGMAVELFTAAIALFIWINVEPGTFRAILYNVIFIAGVSSVLFNGNPLLRYDAYYILADLLEIPNLAPKGVQYAGYLMQRYPFGLRDLEPPISTFGERVWLIVYTIASFAYRIAIYLSIVLFIAGKFFIAGVLLAVWAAVSIIVLPVGKGITFLASSPRLTRNRRRAVGVIALLIFFVAGFISLLPFPLNTQTEAVIWAPERAFVRAGTEGFVERLLVTPGAGVKTDQPLILCSDPLLPARIRVLEARLNELTAIYDTKILSDRVQAEITNEEIKKVTGELNDARKREQELTICSSMDGAFHCPMAQDLPGRFLKRGELLGYVLDNSTLTARAVVSQSRVDLVRSRTKEVNVRFSEKIDRVLPAVIKREAPAATDELPSRILSQQGGGAIAVDPQDALGLRAFQRVFLFDIQLPEHKGLYNVGGRVHVRFNHGWEPLIWRWYRSARQLFIRRFSV